MSNDNINRILQSFPKTRPPLADAYKKIFETEYIANREGTNTVSSLTQKLESWMHKRVATYQSSGPILEVGAGTLNHLSYENLSNPYDVIEPSEFLLNEGQNIHLVRKVYTEIRDIEPDTSYDRIISIAVLEHMLNLPRDLSVLCTHLRDGGTFQAGIPCEGELAWYLGWRYVSGLAFYLRHHLDYAPVMRHEHINTSDEIVTLIKYLFNDVTIKRFPFPFRHLSFYMYIEARKPNFDAVRALLDQNL
ncbi:MAG: class I SAM-dependent methyltransferase [Rhodospirillales bacterium]|nr:class I SAM-dependent methyltransferase [Rhodospirillales bacterium]